MGTKKKSRIRLNRKLIRTQVQELDSQRPVPTLLDDPEEQGLIWEMQQILGDLQIPSLYNKETGEFTRARSRKPTFEQCDQLGLMVGIGLKLDEACSLLTPPLKPKKVEQSIALNTQCKLLFTRAISKWKYFASRYIITHPKEAMGLTFLLRTRHAKEYGSKMNIDVTSNGSPLQLTSPEVIQRAREFALEEERKKNAAIIDVQVLAAPLTIEDQKSPMDSLSMSSSIQSEPLPLTKDQIDQQRAEAYLKSMIDNPEE